MLNTPLLEIRSVTAAYGAVVAVHEVSLVVKAGEKVALLGANGAGKSTLLRTILGFNKTSAGTITFDGVDLSGLNTERRIALGIGYAPEGRRVFPGMTVRENLEVATAPRDWERTITDVYGLFPQLAEHERTPAWQLSGGQQQMLAIGRALMSKPRLLLLDEPSLGLSPRLIQDVVGRVRRIAELGTAVLLAEQNALVALKVVDRAYILRTGKVVHEGTPDMLHQIGALGDAILGTQSEARSK